MTIISNTTVLSNFASIGALDLLRQLYQTLTIPVEVYEEIEVGLREGYTFYEGIQQLIFPMAEPGWLQMTSLNEEELRRFSELSSRLHPTAIKLSSSYGVGVQIFRFGNAVSP